MAATCVVRPGPRVEENEYCRQRILHSTTGWAEKVQFQAAIEQRITATTYVGVAKGQTRHARHTANSSPHARSTPNLRVCMPSFLLSLTRLRLLSTNPKLSISLPLTLSRPLSTLLHLCSHRILLTLLLPDRKLSFRSTVQSSCTGCGSSTVDCFSFHST